MKTPRLALALLLLGFAGLGAAIAFLKWDNARLQQRTAEALRRQAQAGRIREENRRARALVAQARAGEGHAVAAIQAEVGQLRDEIARLEKQARASRVARDQAAVRDATQLDTNRDPRLGLVRLELMADVGAGAPEAALQTLIWASLKGAEAKLESLICLSPAAREEALALVATLPADARPAWSPEKLAGLFFTGIFTESSAVAIESISPTSPAQAVVTLRLTNGARDIRLPLVAEAAVDGRWRVQLPEQALGALKRRVAAVAKNSSP